MPRREIVIFNGVRFRRYPDAKDRSSRVYFNPGIADRRRGIESLHREIWKAAHGPIPPGCDIHHRDGNPLNNALDNLECLTEAEHNARHDTGAWGRTEAGQAHLAAIRPLTVEWHRSPAGRQWHSENGKRVWKTREPVRKSCDQCHAAYDDITRRADSRFCSNACKSEWRRAQGVDAEDRTCPACGVVFRVRTKYAKQRACSRVCGGRLQAATKRLRAGLQPDRQRCA